MSDEQVTDSHADPADESATVSDAAPDAIGSEVTDVHPAGDAWRDVMSQLDALGEAMGRWARAATHEPENRERARELKEHMDQMAKTVGGAVDEVVGSEVGQSFRDAAVKTGEAFRAASDRVAEEVSPRVAAAFRMTAEKLHQAAERLETKAEAPEGEAPAAPAAESATSDSAQEPSVD